MNNGITIHHKGESYEIPLWEDEADQLSDLTIGLDQAPRKPDRGGIANRSPLPPERVKARTERHNEYNAAGEAFQKVLRRIANLDEHQTGLLLAWLDILEMGDFEGESNWILQSINDMLYDVIYEGAAGALHQDPRPMIAAICHNIGMYWMFVASARQISEKCPDLFPELHQEPPEPQKPARKPRKKAA